MFRPPSTGGSSFNGGTVANATTFESLVSLPYMTYTRAMDVPLAFFTDFSEAIAFGYNNVASGGTFNLADSTYNTAKHAGHARLRVTTSATPDIQALAYGSAGIARPLGGDVGWDTQLCIRAANLNDGSNDVEFEFGFGDTFITSADQVDGATIKYNSSSLNFQYGTRNNSTGSWTASTFAVTAANHQFLRVNVNPAGTLVTFSAMNDGDTSWTVLGTLSTNIPTGAGRFCAPFMRLRKASGTTIREWFPDKWLIQSYV